MAVCAAVAVGVESSFDEMMPLGRVWSGRALCGEGRALCGEGRALCGDGCALSGESGCEAMYRPNRESADADGLRAALTRAHIWKREATGEEGIACMIRT